MSSDNGTSSVKWPSKWPTASQLQSCCRSPLGNRVQIDHLIGAMKLHEPTSFKHAIINKVARNMQMGLKFKLVAKQILHLTRHGGTFPKTIALGIIDCRK